MKRTLRIGVAGIGFGASVHIPAFQSEGLEVVAVCARRQVRAEAAARRFGIPYAFSDFRSMLMLDGLDAVSIVTPTNLHYEMSLAALEAGKHVICEKPLAVGAGQAREMWQRAKDSGLTAMVTYEFRFAPAVRGAKQLIESGYIGRLRMCLVRLIIAGPRLTGARAGAPGDGAVEGGGLLLGIGSHYIDCLRYWFGEVESVSGQLLNFGAEQWAGAEAAQAGSDDTFLFTLQFAGGGFAQMIGTLAAPFGTGASIEIYGSAGTLIAPSQEVSWRALSPRGRNPPAGGRVFAGRVGDDRLQELPAAMLADSQVPGERDVHLLPFRQLVREFVRGVEEGHSPSPSFYDGMRCQEILDAVRLSASTGQRVTIPRVP